jgi:hypothetical protein
MSDRSIFDAWAPESSVWARWTKPVLFSQMTLIDHPAIVSLEPTVDSSWAVDPERTTVVVVDLAGAEGITLGLSLASRGYRPVPLYNACPVPPGTRGIVDVQPIMAALSAGATMLKSLELPNDAPPAFLLDARRNTKEPELSPKLLEHESIRMAGFLSNAEPLARETAATTEVFDNRSISLPTDFPSASLLQSAGFQRVVLVQQSHAEPRADLSHTLRRWQDGGLSIFAVATDEPGSPRPITIKRPSAFRLFWYRLLAKLGLKARPLGGFGGLLAIGSSG